MSRHHWRWALLMLSLMVLSFARGEGGNQRTKLTPEALIHIAETSSTYGEFVARLTKEYPPVGRSLFWSSDRGVEATSSATPQYFIMVDGVTIAIAPDRFSEAVFNQGEKTTVIHVVSDENGKPVMNQFRFAQGDVAKTDVEHHISSEIAKELGPERLADKSVAYETVSCVGCHLALRRRLFEADNHHRVFDPDKDWVFRDERHRPVIEALLHRKVKEFDNPETRANPVYSWVFEEPSVIRRGYVTGADLVTPGRVYRQMAADTANEFLGELKGYKDWPLLKKAFEYAVNGDPRLDVELKRVAQIAPALFSAPFPTSAPIDPNQLDAERERIDTLEARRNLTHFKLRNARSMAYVLAKDDQREYKKLLAENILLLNHGAIENVGPQILDLVVSDAEWEKLPPPLRSTHVRLSDLDVRNMDELKKLASSPENVEAIRRRVNTHLVLRLLLGSDQEAMYHLSTSIGSTAETRGRGSDLIENFARALRRFGPDTPQYTRESDPESSMHAEADLEEIYLRNVAFRTNAANLHELISVARRTLGDDHRVDEVVKLVTGDLNRFLAVHSEIVDKFARTEVLPLERVVVAGKNIPGMIVAAVAAQSGHQVELFDTPDTKIETGAFPSRQAMIDELASIDPRLARKFRLLIDENAGERTLPGDPRRLPRSGAELLAQKPVGTVDTKLFADLLNDYVTHHRLIHVHKGTVKIGAKAPSGRYEVSLETTRPNEPPETLRRAIVIFAGPGGKAIEPTGSVAALGENVFLLGHAVGEHLSADDQAIGAVSHIERFKNFLLDWWSGVPVHQAAYIYSQGVMKDSDAAEPPRNAAAVTSTPHCRLSEI